MTYGAGDVLEIQTDAGVIYGVVRATDGAYPPAVAVFERLCAVPLANPGGELANDPMRVVLVPLDAAQAAGRVRRVGHRAPAAPPLFRVPIRDAQGRELYDWIWQSGQIRLRRDADAPDLPIREIQSLDAVVQTLQAHAG